MNEKEHVAAAIASPGITTVEDARKAHDSPEDSLSADAEQTARRVLRKIDLRILPVLFAIYLIQYLDKNGINYASVYGLQKGTHLVGQDFSWLGSIFYFGYMVAQYPAGYLLQRLPTGKVLSLAVIGFGIILLTTPACHNFAGIAANRFLLGALEASVNPGFILVISMWYTSAEQPFRLSSYYCTNGIATMFGGLLGYAIGHIESGLARWKYVFLIFGAISFVCGVWALWQLPDDPATAKFLTQTEKAIAIDRVAANRQGLKNRHFKKYQAFQTMYDPKTWILFVMAVGAQVPNSALTSFTSLIIQSFGVDTLGTQYLQIPGGAVQFLSLLIGGWLCTRFPNSRCITMIVANSICIIGSALLVALPTSNRWGRLVALWLCYFQGLGFSMSLTMVSSNIAGSTKKQLTAAILFTGYCVGNIIGPQTFRSSEAPGYRSAYIAMLAGYSVKLVSVLVLYMYMWTVNRRRDRRQSLADDGAAGSRNEALLEREAIDKGLDDMTEFENEGFRYVL